MIGATGIVGHMSVDEVKVKMQMTSGFMKIRKWLVIYNAIVDPRPCSEIAKHTGLSEASVQRIIMEYNRLGPEALDTSDKTMNTEWFERRSNTISG